MKTVERAVSSTRRHGESTEYTDLNLSSPCFLRVLRVSVLKRKPSNRRGGALLMVLWVSAALAAIGFSVASTVRGETERTATGIDGLRAYYLAVGGVQRAMIELLWAVMYPEERM